MNIIIHDYAGHAFTVQLSRELARRGHSICHAYLNSFQGPKGELAQQPGDPATLTLDGIQLFRHFHKYSLPKRWAQEIEYGYRLRAYVTRKRPDIVISNAPLDVQQLLVGGCCAVGAKFVIWAQDIYSIAINQTLRKAFGYAGIILGHRYTRLERKLMRQSDRVIVITKDFQPLLYQWGVKKESVRVIPNWAPLEQIPVRPKDNDWSRRHMLKEKFCILYSGTLGMKHNPELLLKLALHFRPKPEVEVVVVSEGLGANWLKQKKADLSLQNLSIKDFQPFHEFANVLASADILVAILEPEAGKFSVPSKVLSYMCAQRALLLAVPPENLASKIVSHAEAGTVVNVLDANSLVRAADVLFMDSQRREFHARRARDYAEATFSIGPIADVFEETLVAVCSLNLESQ